MTSDLRELVKTIASFSGAASMFGVSQLARLADIRSPMQSFADATRRLDAVTRSVTAQLEGRLATAFERGDVLERRLVDLATDLVTLNPGGVLSFGAPVVEEIAALVDPLAAAVDRVLPGTDALVRWQELRNQIEVFFLVENAPTQILFSPETATPLYELVERAFALGDFPALWVIEGLGEVWGVRALQSATPPRGLLTGPEAAAAREGALPMLHAGVGLAFAYTLLQSVNPQNADAMLEPVLGEIVQLCRDNSQPAHLGAALESIGLAARTFHDNLLAQVAAALERAAADTLGYFWHGVGRATYFATRNFLPCAALDWSAIRAAAPDENGRSSITAGLAWAVTLVNMRQPAIMERLLRQHGNLLAQDPGFAAGVGSAAMVRQVSTPEAPFIGPFVQHEPDPADGNLCGLWASQVRCPALAAFSCAQQAGGGPAPIGEFFQFPFPACCSGPHA
jgi:hypothetical protein